MISRWRRKNREKKEDGQQYSSILPTTYQPATSPPNRKLNASINTSTPTSISSPLSMSMGMGNHHHHHSVNPNSVTCTNFLMGGQYYPGKDKHRVHLRRRTLWYRIFWSSSFRRGCSTIMLVYVLTIYVLNPAFHSVLSYGKILSNPGAVMDQDDDNQGLDPVMDKLDNGNAYVKPLRFAKEDGVKIIGALRKIKNQKISVDAKNQLLRKIIPSWFQGGDENNGDEEHNGLGTADRGQADEQEIGGTFVATTEKDIRTLHNKNMHHKYSQCPRGIEDVSTTLVIQSTLDRLPLITTTCHRWKSAIVLVVYLSQEELDSIWNARELSDFYIAQCPNLKIVLHIAQSADERQLAYPINVMRNIGLDQVVTSHVLVLDIDLIPSIDLDRHVHDAIELAIDERADDDGDRGVDPHDAIIVPAFERKVTDAEGVACQTLEDCQKLAVNDPEFMPTNISSVSRCMEEQNCIVFQGDNNWEGHYDTQTERWLKTKNENSLTHIQCFHSQRYEPYVVIPWCPIEANAAQRLALWGPRSPYYDERFYGYGKNKIQQIAHLRERGYKFLIMPTTGFVTHHPHPESMTKETWKDKKNHDLHNKMDKLYPKYLGELDRAYDGDFVEVPLCKRKKRGEKKRNADVSNKP